MPNLNNILVKHNVIPCSRECVDGEGKAPFADENWHHTECPNHSVKCCVVGYDNA